MALEAAKREEAEVAVSGKCPRCHNEYFVYGKQDYGFSDGAQSIICPMCKTEINIGRLDSIFGEEWAQDVSK